MIVRNLWTSLLAIVAQVPSLSGLPASRQNLRVNADPVPSQECAIFTTGDSNKVVRNSTLQAAEKCIRDEPGPPKPAAGNKWPFFDSEGCDALRVANWPGIQISLEKGDSGFYSLYRNQENNGLRRACQKVYETATDLESQGMPPDVSSEMVVQDDSYVWIEWWREPAVDAALFPYALMSEIVYTVWLWVVNTGQHNALWIPIHQMFGNGDNPKRIGTMAIRSDWHWFAGNGAEQNQTRNVSSAALIYPVS